MREAATARLAQTFQRGLLTLLQYRVTPSRLLGTAERILRAVAEETKADSIPRSNEELTSLVRETMCRLAPSRRKIQYWNQSPGKIQQVRTVLDSLDARDRQLARLYYLRELTVEQIVDVTGVQEVEIRARLAVVRKTIASATDR